MVKSMNKHSILCIDLKSFYASVECVDRGLDPFLYPLVVADKERGSGSIVLAVSPYLKSFGVPSRLRIFELPKFDIIFAKPRMKRYLEISAKIISIYLDYVGEDDIHVYSIDECFLDVTHYLKFHNCSSEELALKIKKRIYEEFLLTCTIGIGENMLLAKLSMDIEAKHTANGIAYWSKEDIKTKLWPIKPLSKMWGIGKNYEKKLNKLGIYTIGDLACYPKKLLIDKFGIMGGQLHEHANGIDESNIRHKYIPNEESISSGQVFFEDYYSHQIPLIIQEMLDDLLLRLIYQQKFCLSVSLSIAYSKDFGGGFTSSKVLPTFCDDFATIYRYLLSIFDKKIENKPIRSITISLNRLIKSSYYQPNLLESFKDQEKKRRLLFTIAKIKNKYGNNAILRANSKLEYSNIYNRHNLIGGHNK